MNDNDGDDLELDDEFDNLLRHGDPERRKQTIAKLLERLAELKRSTTPFGGEETAAEKGQRAFTALNTAGWIVRLMAGWAIDHHVGMAMRKLNFIPAPPARHHEHPEFLELSRQVDDHQLERDGAHARHAQLAPDVARTLLYNLLHANPGAFPSNLQHSLMEA
jgi:hypothetical protein